MGRSVQREHAERPISPFLKAFREFREGGLLLEGRKDEGTPEIFDPRVQGSLCFVVFRRRHNRVPFTIYREPTGRFPLTGKCKHQAIPAKKVE
jgi:hypothetical protein